MEIRRRNQAEQIALVKEQLASGQTVKEFCRKRGLNHFTFSSWRQRHSEVVRGEEFLEVTAGQTERQVKESRLKVVLGHATVEIAGEVDEAQVEAVLRAIGRSSC